MNRVDLRVIKSRDALFDAGIRCLLQNPAVTLSEVAKRAGVGRATLYRHFKTREDLIRALAVASLDETQAACAHITEKKIKGKAALTEVLRSVIPLGERYHFLVSLWNYIEDDPKIARIYAGQLEKLTEMVEDAKDDGDIPRDIPTQWVTAQFDSHLQLAWMMLSNGEWVQTETEVIDLAIDTFFNGISQGSR